MSTSSRSTGDQVARSPHRARRSIAAVALGLALVAAPVVLLASPASALPGAITVSKPTGVDPAGERITVTGSGYTPGQGLYIQFCRQPTGTLGAADGRAAACNPDQANDHTIWKTPIASDGTFTVELAVQSSWAGTDCATVTCGVFTRRDHMGGATDYSQDAFTAVAFAAAAVVETTTTTTTTAAPAAAPSATAAASAAAPRLAETGSSTTSLALLGGAAFVGGGAILLASRRKAASHRV